MKSFLLIISLFSCSISFAQITEGQIVYSMQLYDGENEAGGAVQMLERSEMTVKFAKSNTLTSVKMGDEMEIATILNKEEGKGLILMTGFMGDLAITATYAELTDSKEESEIELLGQTKEIQGYKCKRAKIYYENGSVASYWYTNEIKFNMTGIENLHSSIPGTPLEYKIDSDGSIMTYTAKSINTSLEGNSSSPFITTPPTGHKIMTYQEFEENGF